MLIYYFCYFTGRRRQVMEESIQYAVYLIILVALAIPLGAYIGRL